jgi:hypothetical protein
MPPFIRNPITTASGPIKTKIKCTPKKGFNPNMEPNISFLSTYSSKSGVYTVVTITGMNFFPFGVTSVNFGKYKNIDVLFYSGAYISFVVPIKAPAGVYNVQLTNNISSITNSHLIYSNSIAYIVD